MNLMRPVLLFILNDPPPRVPYLTDQINLFGNRINREIPVVVVIDDLHFFGDVIIAVNVVNYSVESAVRIRYQLLSLTILNLYWSVITAKSLTYKISKINCTFFSFCTIKVPTKNKILFGINPRMELFKQYIRGDLSPFRAG